MDLVAVVEGLYRLDLAPDDWLAEATDLLRPLLDRHRLGIIGNFYECVDACSYIPCGSVMRDVRAGMAGRFFTYIVKPDPAYIARSILSRRWYFSGRIPGPSDVRETLKRTQRDYGVVDRLTINVVEPDGNGCCIGSFQADGSPLTPRAGMALTRVARHFGAAHRLRRRFDLAHVSAEATAAAVMTADGRVHHAVGVAATDQRLRRDLGRAVRARDAARTRRARQDSLSAIRDWKPFVGGRWMLLDHAECDGRQFVLAVESEPPDRLALLSPREREVVQRMMAGQSDKVIAYELALAPGTVRTLMGRSMAKLGAHSRAELRAMATRLRRNE